MRIAAAATALTMLILPGCQKQAGTPSSAPNATTPAAVTPGLPGVVTPATPAPAGPSLGQATDSTGELRMEVTEAIRTGGVLTVKTRFTLVGGKPGSRPLPGGSTSDVYLTAGDKKFLMLKDDHDKELMSSSVYPDFDHVGAMQTWWAKFPAPSLEVKAVDFYFYKFEPVENVAVTDR